MTRQPANSAHTERFTVTCLSCAQEYGEVRLTDARFRRVSWRARCSRCGGRLFLEPLPSRIKAPTP